MKWITIVKKVSPLLLKRRIFTLQFASAHSRQYSRYLGKWELQPGYETGINIYNTAASKKVPLILKNKDLATWYVCGPTVYDESHIGHASCYIKFDIIRRIMERFFGINVLLLMGITDIDDKIIKKASELNLTFSEVSKRNELDFFKDMSSVAVQPPSLVARVSENIPHIIYFIETLIGKEYAYATEEGNVYFMVSKGVSADILFESSEEETLTAFDPMKKDKRDFALWKASKEKEPYWLSPWGKGRPGWHIECSAMASKAFGSHLDIHSGGYDLLFPHHSNEKSQSEAYHGCCQWVNYWLHSGLLQVGDEIKMSKSIKNTITIKEFLKDNSVNDLRMLCLQSPYRKNILYCSETLTGAKGLHKKFHNFINECDWHCSMELRMAPENEDRLFLKLKNTKEQVMSLLADDFNTSQAVLCISELIDEVNESLQSSSIAPVSRQGITVVAACSNYVNTFLELLGVNIMTKKKLREDLLLFMDEVIKFRNQIRLFALCQLSTDENVSALQFIDNAYASFRRNSCLFINAENFSGTFNQINRSVDLLHKQASEFTVGIKETETSILVNTKAERKKRKDLLHFCDELRSSLEKSGIAIKDRREVSTWLPLTTLQL